MLLPPRTKEERKLGEEGRLRHQTVEGSEGVEVATNLPAQGGEGVPARSKTVHKGITGKGRGKEWRGQLSLAMQ